MRHQRRRHPVGGAFSGFFLGLFIGFDLLLFGVVPLNSMVLTIAPFVGLVVGLALGALGPVRGRPPKYVAPDGTINTTAAIDAHIPKPPPPSVVTDPLPPTDSRGRRAF